MIGWAEMSLSSDRENKKETLELTNRTNSKEKRKTIGSRNKKVSVIKTDESIMSKTTSEKKEDPLKLKIRLEKEAEIKRLESLNLIYPTYKYRKEYPPNCLYLPSEELMLQIIRSCIGIKDIEKLVFYKECHIHENSENEDSQEEK